MTQASKFLVRMKRVAGSGRILTFGLLLAALVAASLLLAAKPAHAKTFTVNTTSDDSGGKACDLGECTCDASECILRAAIEQANRTAGTDTINFNIPGDGPHTISPSASLPEITDPVIINGYSQPGSKPNALALDNNAVLKIELSGANARGWSSGLRIQAANSTIKGLAINRWGFGGIAIGGAEAKGNRVMGNFIGTDATGKQDLGNSSDGVFIEGVSKNNVVGGTVTGARNLISGNDRNGVYIYGAGATSNSILSNSIHSNGSLGIDLTRDSFPPSPDGVTANDEDDPDAGPNNLQNYPVINSAIASGRRITIKGTLNSLPNRTYTIQFFSSPSGTGQGQQLVGQKVVTTDANGDASFTFSKRQRMPVERDITATATIHHATDTSKLLDTSEFSAAMSVVHPD